MDTLFKPTQFIAQKNKQKYFNHTMVEDVWKFEVQHLKKVRLRETDAWYPVKHDEFNTKFTVLHFLYP